MCGMWIMVDALNTPPHVKSPVRRIVEPVDLQCLRDGSSCFLVLSRWLRRELLLWVQMIILFHCPAKMYLVSLKSILSPLLKVVPFFSTPRDELGFVVAWCLMEHWSQPRG